MEMGDLRAAQRSERCASGCGAAWGGTRSLARASPTPTRQRQPELVANRGDTTATRRSGAGSVSPPGRHRRGLGALKAKVLSSAKVPDQDGLRLLLQSARTGLSRLSHLWLDAGGYEGRGKRWAEEVLGLSVEVVRTSHPSPYTGGGSAARWAAEWAKEGKEVDWQGLMPPRGYVALPRRWVVERTFSPGFLRTEEDEQGLREAMRHR
jgi:hypothetical protein